MRLLHDGPDYRLGCLSCGWRADGAGVTGERAAALRRAEAVLTRRRRRLRRQRAAVVAAIAEGSR